MTTDVDLFDCAVQEWQREPYDAEAFDELLIAIVESDQEAAIALARKHVAAQDPHLRATAYQLLAVTAQLGDERIRTAVAGVVLAQTGEHEPDVLVGIVRALGGAQDERGLPILTALAAHPDVQVRHQVAADLPMVIGNPPDPSGVAALITLSADDQPEIRDWATFALGTQTDADSDEVRAALWARTADSDADARDEAVFALARRKDSRVLAVVAELLAQPGPGTLIFQAATELADPTLLPLLLKFDITDDDVLTAIQACQGVSRAAG